MNIVIVDMDPSSGWSRATQLCVECASTRGQEPISRQPAPALVFLEIKKEMKTIMGLPITIPIVCKSISCNECH